MEQDEQDQQEINLNFDLTDVDEHEPEDDTWLTPELMIATLRACQDLTSGDEQYLEVEVFGEEGSGHSYYVEPEQEPEADSTDLSNSLLSLIQSKLQLKELKDSGVVRQGLKARGHIPEKACCGNCANLTYSGVMEVKMEYGNCEEYQVSERFVVKPEMQGCPFWRQRSLNRTAHEHNYAKAMKTAINQMNIQLYGGTRYIEKIDLPKRPKELDADKKTATSAFAAIGIDLASLIGGSTSEDDE